MQTTTMGLVLRATKTGEADRVLSVLTPAGIVSAIAKGSLRLKNRLHSATGLFCYSEFTLLRGKPCIWWTRPRCARCFGACMKTW